MPYQRLAARLADGPNPAVSTLPDGSIDRYCRLSAGALDPIDRRATFAKEIAQSARKGFGLDPERVEPGGQSVNAANQAHALGAEATCYGHLDDPVFEELPFETVSMGEPAVVNVLDFEDDDLLLVEHSADMVEWTLDDLRAVVSLPRLFGVDGERPQDCSDEVAPGHAIACSNWVSIPGLADAFQGLAEQDLPRVPFVFDPGDVLGSTPEQHRELRQAVRALQSTVDVVVSVNRTELHALAAALDEPPEPPVDDEARASALRQAFDGAAVVKHGKEEALAATDTGIVAVENPLVQDQHQTGGGDRFDGGLAVGLGSGWDWSVALACGNACASHYVATGETATADALRAWIV